MKRLMSVVLITIASIFATNSFAVEGLPSADEIVSQASKSRIDFLKVVGLAEPRIPYIPGKDELTPYIKIIPALEKIAQDLKFEAFGGDPLKGYKNSISTAAVKWTDITTDDLDVLKIIISSADSRAALLFLEIQNVIFAGLKSDKEAFFLATLKLGELDLFVKENVKDVEVRSTFRDHQGDIISILLSDNTVTLEQIEKLMKIASGPVTVQNLLDYILKNMYLFRTGQELQKILVLAVESKHVLESADFLVPSYLLELPGMLILATIEKSVNTNGAIDIHIVDSLLEILEVRQMDELAQKLIASPRDMLKEEQIKFLLEVSLKLQTKLDSYAMYSTVRSLEDFISRLFLIENVTSKLEGMYSLEIGSRDYLMTVVRSQRNELSVNLWSPVNSFGMFYSYYDHTRKMFIVSRFPKDSQGASASGGQNYTIDFNLNKKNQIFGTFVNGTFKYKILATKIQKIPDYLDAQYLSKPQMTPAEGTYIGMAGAFYVRLIVNKVGYYYNASISFYENSNRQGNPLFLSPGFNTVYFQKWNGALYMTTGEVDSHGFHHARGQLKNGVIKGYFFSGTTYDRFKNIPMNLKKIK